MAVSEQSYQAESENSGKILLKSECYQFARNLQGAAFAPRLQT